MCTSRDAGEPIVVEQRTWPCLIDRNVVYAPGSSAYQRRQSRTPERRYGLSHRPPPQRTNKPPSCAHPQHTDVLASRPPPPGHTYRTLLLAPPRCTANGLASHPPPPGHACGPLLLAPPSHHYWKAILSKSPMVPTLKASRRPQQDPPD